MVSHAIWLCACETMDESPAWLVYTVGEDGIGWQRIPAGMDVSEVVEAEHLTGCHPAPEGVLAWLRREWPDPWRGRADSLSTPTSMRNFGEGSAPTSTPSRMA